jgi:trk system potassium uptake protein TrkH
MSTLQKIRERINLLLYDSKEVVLRIIKVLNVLVSLGAFGTLIYYYGVPHTEESKEILLEIIKGSFIFYIFSYLIRLLYNFEPKKFLRNHMFEGIMMIFLLIEGISYNFFGTLLLPRLFVEMGMEGFADFSTIFIQFYFVAIVGIEFWRSANINPILRLHPATIFMISFLLIILLGAGLLMLPNMTYNGISIIDAIFTSTSATCVTGLITMDPATDFTFTGQVVILILVKLGGLNIIAFGAFIMLAAKFGVGVKHHSVIEDFVNKDSVISTKGMLGKIILWSIAIELVGSFLMFIFWDADIPQIKSTGDKVFFSLFHSISAFNNAGLSLFEGGLYNEAVRENYFIHLNITWLVFVGALGMAALFNLFDIKRLRDRLKNPWKQIEFGTKIALYFSLALVIGGVIAFYFLEYNNTLKDQSFGEALITSLFQSVTRTSGFNTVDFGSVSTPMIIFMMFLMFVGASSSSTGGGIKTSTFAILWANTIATMRGKKNVELFKKTVSNDLIGKAFSIFLFFIAGNLICIFLLSITEQHLLADPNYSVVDLMFEQVSAFGTVGLSTGLTSELSEAGKCIIMVSMFVGRIGTLTVAYLVGKSLISTNYKYPQGHTMVG